MDIIRFKGGLGNQMFQYALLEALRSRGRKCYGSLGYYNRHSESRPFILNEVFEDVTFELISDKIFDEIDEKWKKIKCDKAALINFMENTQNRFFWVEETKDFSFQKKVFETKNCVFVGYWQTEKYFKDIRKILLNKFKFQINNKKIQDLKKKLKNCYSIHVRRGDYIGDPELGEVYNIMYYNRAIEYILKKRGDVSFIVFSDDMQWVNDNLKIPNRIDYAPEMIEDYKDWYDMYLMTCCAGNIIANSSFSWWGAWLNQNKDKIVLAPDKWFINIYAPDIWCDDWIRICTD